MHACAFAWHPHLLSLLLRLVGGKRLEARPAPGAGEELDWTELAKAPPGLRVTALRSLPYPLALAEAQQRLQG